ncbi:Nramp family divalent metal transporter [Mangrovimonas cancribranchiae]|uniref:Nramp family divalent metal transporter n=1 Tax=Mangrovimonas cancribranchiae TaxID=3080055 RepID=A0AAU6P812_9FLAO
MMLRFKSLGPGLLFAGAAIGVSHLVQSTRAGADFGFGLIWALLLINIIKYPFFQFGPRYATATGESLLDGYKRLGNGVLIAYFIITFATMFTIQTAVTIVTAGLGKTLFGLDWPIEYWTLLVLATCLGILLKGRYAFLDKLMKVIVVTLTISTIAAVVMATSNTNETLSFSQIIPNDTVGIAFLIAFMGWMPAPLDISVWHSLWSLEKKKMDASLEPKTALFDFNVGFFSTIIIGLCFLALGALVMHQSNVSFSSSAAVFSNQLITMYTDSLGHWAYWLIGIAAFTTMFSTTLTTLDASPRAMDKTTSLLFSKNHKKGYLFWILLLTIGTLAIFFLFLSEMGTLIEIATILSFLTAPFYAILNYKLISSKHTPQAWRPSKTMHIFSWISIIFLIGFSVWYLTTI